MDVTLNAYAKINLFLDVDSLRQNGYHNILSLMQTVSLYDTITVEYRESESKKIKILCDNENIPCDNTNLAYRAIEKFPINNGEFTVKIQKRIPMSAGLAGGSADAAATLKAINILTGNKLSESQLIEIGYSLGADIPFCIVGGACKTEGIGEILTPVSSMPRLPIVIAKHGEGMSTPMAYGMLDKKYDYFKNRNPQTSKLNEIISNTDTIPSADYFDSFYNIFESVVQPIRPNVTLIKQIMQLNESVVAMMSGSGTSVFGVFKNDTAADKALNCLLSKGIEAYKCYPVNCVE